MSTDPPVAPHPRPAVDSELPSGRLVALPVPDQRRLTAAAISVERGDDPSPVEPAVDAAGLDVAVALTHLVYDATAAVAGEVGRRLAPVTGFLLRPPLLPARRSPAALLGMLADRGRRDVEAAVRRVREVTLALTPRLLDAVLDSIDVNEMVLERLDLDRLAAALDVDAVVARVDVDRVVERVDVERVVDRVDVERVVSRVDVDRVVDRVDVERVVNRVDIDRVATDLDLEAILRRVDVDAVVARADPQAVLDRVDLVDIARGILDALDLPSIIRESTGFLASDAVHGFRARSATADAAVGSALSRLLPRRHRSGHGEPPVAGTAQVRGAVIEGATDHDAR